jgi:adenylate kinase
LTSLALRSGYSQKKLTENIDCEIFAVVLEEARDSYDEDVVRAMKSETAEDQADNVAAIVAFVTSYEPREEQAAKKTRGARD